MRKDSRRRDRGFTIIELMIVVGVIGVIASLAIPNYLRFTARTSRSEMLETVSKIKLSFKNVYDNTGKFASTDFQSAVNPSAAIAVGQAASWDTQAPDWSDLQFPPEGGVKMRYWYKVQAAGQELLISVCGHFPGIGAVSVTCPSGLTGTANYLYTEVFHGNGTSDAPSEIPAF